MGTMVTLKSFASARCGVIGPLQVSQSHFDQLISTYPKLVEILGHLTNLKLGCAYKSRILKTIDFLAEPQNGLALWYLVG